ncbi:MAG: SDR family oxidoreductase [Bacteroidetes bacterium]|nr:SDR family oxidoreductase [Bacteroidota bacterium]
MTVNNTIVCITGASSGIGKAAAKKFAEQGARVLLCARRIDRLHELENDLKKKFSADVFSAQLDVRNQHDVQTFFANLPAEWKEISLLVNNAGLSRGLNPIHAGELSDWNEMIDTNIKGLLYVTRAVLPGMIERSEGHIINIGSTAGFWVYPKGNVYNATKFAVNALTQGIKMDLLGTPIRVTEIDPGLVETEFSEVRFHGDKERAAAVYKGMTPLTADDVADSILWAATRPAHVNISNIILMPTDQSSPTLVHRR